MANVTLYPKVELHEQPYREWEYQKNRLTRDTWYAAKDGNGNFVEKTKETVYVYQGEKLIAETVTYYRSNGAVENTRTYSYTTVEQGNTVKIKREES